MVYTYLGKGTSNSMAFIEQDVEEIKAASCTTWKGLPPATGRGTWPTTDAMKNSKGQGSEDSDIENIWQRYRLIALIKSSRLDENC